LHEDHTRQAGHLAHKRVLGEMAVTGVVLAAEIVGGILTNSLALLTDAGHMLTDLLALGLSYFAISIARRPPTDEKTYGFHRMEIPARRFVGLQVGSPLDKVLTAGASEPLLTCLTCRGQRGAEVPAPAPARTDRLAW
jgi:hypothetical protein